MPETAKPLVLPSQLGQSGIQKVVDSILGPATYFFFFFLRIQVGQLSVTG